jgi:NAD(P)-dependent dehydrogenase (short-subunit alcohol dehydrogenase family)
VLPGDTTVRHDVDSAASALEAAWPHLDRAFLNAGTSFGVHRVGGAAGGEADSARQHHLECCSAGSVTAADFSADVFEGVMRVNVLGVVYWLEHLFRRMRAQGRGTIAVTGSLAADRPLPRSSAYSTSKAAVRALVESLRFDACRLGIQLCLVEPGFVETTGADPARHVMPFLQPVDRASRRIVRGVEAGEATIRFPWQASLLSRLISIAPRPIYERWVRSVLEEGGT